ncbi:MAG: ADP-ribosylglycohydrolase family protein [Prochloraceae cyanobacterium]|nr:ADP-ribosylglycohydrolase family protein [Prochloraceae cyanobacterium]
MGYSLVLRFQGALIGSYLGENFSNSYPKLTQQKQGSWTEMGIELAEILYGSDKLTRTNWQKLQNRNVEKLNGKNFDSCREIAIAIAPVVLLFHESTSLLTEKLTQILKMCDVSAETSEYLLVWAYFLAAIVKEKSVRDISLFETIQKTPIAKTHLAPEIEAVERYSKEGTSLEKIVSYLSRQNQPDRGAIALAIYCFNYTREDFRLCLLRAKNSNFQTNITPALVGAIAGAYNSINGIPINWRIYCQKQSDLHAIDNKAKELFSLWSGVYQPSSNKIPSYAAVAAPQIVQPRSSLKIISQEK